MVRLLYLEKVAGNAKVNELLERLQDMYRQEHEEKHVFKETASGWVAQAA